MRRTAMKSSQTATATRVVYSSGKDVALSVVMSSNAANTSNSASIVTTASLGRRRLAAVPSVEISRPILVTSVMSSDTVLEKFFHSAIHSRVSTLTTETEFLIARPQARDRPGHLAVTFTLDRVSYWRSTGSIPR